MSKKNLFGLLLLTIIIGSTIGVFFYADYSGKNYHEEKRGGPRPWIEVRYYHNYENNKNYSRSGEISATPCKVNDIPCLTSACLSLANKTADLFDRDIENGIWLCGVNPRFFFGHTSYKKIIYSDGFPTGFENGTSVSVRSWLQEFSGF